MKPTEKIRVSQLENQTLIEIIPERDSLKTKILLAWLIVWTLCGIVVFSQFFSNMSKEEKLLMAVWMAFWAYFEFKISNAYAWRKSGYEKISIDPENFSYSQIVSNKAATRTFITENISDLSIYEFGKNNFSDSFQSSYWVKGNETVFFVHLAQKVGLGLQLKNEEASRLHQVISKAIKKKKLALV